MESRALKRRMRLVYGVVIEITTVRRNNKIGLLHCRRRRRRRRTLDPSEPFAKFDYTQRYYNNNTLSRVDDNKNNVFNVPLKRDRENLTPS